MFSIRDSVCASPDLGMIRCSGRGAPRLCSAGLHSAIADCVANWNEMALPVFLGSQIFSPQSFSSGHKEGLPIGIISSFVLLTSMKLISLVF